MGDFSQYHPLPHFRAAQPGETYYYSPLGIFIFGLIDLSMKPTKLEARVYHEGEGKKGGNNVALMVI
jgi:hypothetical protein